MFVVFTARPDAVRKRRSSWRNPRRRRQGWKIFKIQRDEGLSTLGKALMIDTISIASSSYVCTKVWRPAPLKCQHPSFPRLQQQNQAVEKATGDEPCLAGKETTVIVINREGGSRLASSGNFKGPGIQVTRRTLPFRMQKTERGPRLLSQRP